MQVSYEQELEKVLNQLAHILRGKVTFSEYQDCVLNLLFYRLLSERWKREGKEKAFYDSLQQNNQLPYYWQEDWLFENLLNLSTQQEAPTLISKIKQFKNSARKQEKLFNVAFKSSKLFSQLYLSTKRLNNNSQEANRLFREILITLSHLNLPYLDPQLDLLAMSYTYFLNHASSANVGKTGDFYTPASVAILMAKIVCGRCQKAYSVYDPTCGVGSLLRFVAQESKQIRHIYAQDLNPRSTYLAHLNLVSSQVCPAKLHITTGDVLRKPCYSWRNKRFDIIVANPPFSLPWQFSISDTAQLRLLNFEKIKNLKRADFIFIFHMLYHLKEKGSMATVLPHGLLFRSGVEAHMRQELLEKYNYLDAVISLPSKLFGGTKIATVLLIFAKRRRYKKEILFIEAKDLFESNKKYNTLLPEHIHSISELYEKWESRQNFSRAVTIEEIAQNDYNLSVSHYLNNCENELDEDLHSLRSQIQTIRKKREKLEALIKCECVELGINPPF